MQRFTWIYALASPLSEVGSLSLQTELDAIAGAWKSHGKPLKGLIKIHYSQFIIAQALPEGGLPSGCSIDSLRHAIDEALARRQLRWLPPSEVFFMDEKGAYLHADFRQIPRLIAEGVLTPDTLVLDHTLDQSDDLSRWEQPLKHTWMRRFLPLSAMPPAP